MRANKLDNQRSGFSNNESSTDVLPDILSQIIFQLHPDVRLWRKLRLALWTLMIILQSPVERIGKGVPELTPEELASPPIEDFPNSNVERDEDEDNNDVDISSVLSHKDQANASVSAPPSVEGSIAPVSGTS
ncbi:hypothetical protein HAX54_024403 [Datura stramonium]|uniref:Uncharacterized protein n=1 Tax=Datura stramonium TaxID=4076 RepID=A0ABS8V005_DATST|nr:hypothetical protein [Datura stramonium]